MERARLLVVMVTFLLSGILSGQSKHGLERYISCRLNSQFQVFQTDRLPGPMARTVQTKSGEQHVLLVDGYRVLITYARTEPFINMKVEQLGSSYANDKQVLIESLEVAAAGTQGMESTTPRHERMGGFDVYGTNRKELVGGVLSTYALFNDEDRTVTTIYFLNAEPSERKFHTIAEYRRLRDAFLADYTACVPGSQSSK